MPKGKKAPAESPGGGNGRTVGGRVNKMECMRQTLAQIGNDAKPREIQDHLKRTFGLTMSTKMISTYKGSIGKKAAQQSRMMRAPASGRAVGGGTGGIEDARAVKELADRIGPEEMREWLDVLYP
jgi:hypothetical protein